MHGNTHAKHGCGFQPRTSRVGKLQAKHHRDRMARSILHRQPLLQAPPSTARLTHVSGRRLGVLRALYACNHAAARGDITPASGFASAIRLFSGVFWGQDERDNHEPFT